MIHFHTVSLSENVNQRDWHALLPRASGLASTSNLRPPQDSPRSHRSWSTHAPHASTLKAGNVGGSETLQHCSHCTPRVRLSSVLGSIPLMPAASLARLCTYIGENSLRNAQYHNKNLSAATLLDMVRHKKEFVGTEVNTEEELRHLLRALGFKWSNLHPDYYERIFVRDDVVRHRQVVVPLLEFVLNSPRCFTAFADFSHCNRNDMEAQGWCDLTIRNSNLLPAPTGVGTRLTWFTLLSTEGAVLHADGGLAGTVLQPQAIVDHVVARQCFVRAAQALAERARAAGKCPVLVVDGASVQKMFPSDAIVPSLVRFYMQPPPSYPPTSIR
jgi:hypothetical protein